jgi:hypothetical protein
MGNARRAVERDQQAPGRIARGGCCGGGREDQGEGD